MRRLVVLMGGQSNERDVSRVTGRAVARGLTEADHHVILYDTEQGVMELEDASPVGRKPPAAHEPAAKSESLHWIADFLQTLANVDAVFIALHGGWGEDGTIQAVLDLAQVPYTGSGVKASALAMDKDRAKRVLESHGVRTPEGLLWNVSRRGLPSDSDAAEILVRLGEQVIVKPNAEGSTVGLRLVGSAGEVAAAIRHAARFGDEVLLERFIPGRELTVAVLGDEALPVVEISPHGGLYSYEAKYTKGESDYQVPADLPDDVAKHVREQALAAFLALGCEGFARADFRLNDRNECFCLEVNTIPGMTPLSLVPMAAGATGMGFPALVDRIVELSIERAERRSKTQEVPS